MNGNADLPESATGWQAYQRVKGIAEKGVLEKAKSASRPNGIDFVYVYKPGIIFGRKSAMGKSSIRSKGSWDTMTDIFKCCCCCLKNSAGVDARRLGLVMVSVAETRGGFLDENGGSA